MATATGEIDTTQVRAMLLRMYEQLQAEYEQTNVAVAEFGPRSIIYHEGNRFRVARALFTSQGADRQLLRGKICTACAYGHFGVDNPDYTWEKLDLVDMFKKEAGA